MDILFADDHGLVREGITPFLKTLDSDVNVLEAADFQEAMRLAERYSGPESPRFVNGVLDALYKRVID